MSSARVAVRSGGHVKDRMLASALTFDTSELKADQLASAGQPAEQ